MADMTKESVAEIAKLARVSGTVLTVENGTAPFVIIPNDHKVEDLTRLIHNDHRAQPERKKGTVSVLDTNSFCEYYILFNDPNSRVFADETKSKILAVLDYHGAGDNAPRWGQHRLDLTFRHSDEWKRWKAMDGKRTPQMEFAEFIEDNAPDITNPSAATMLEVARDLSAKTDVDFGSAIRTANGSVQFKYSEQVKGTFGSGNIDVPEQFTIAIPIYIGCDRSPMIARLRYRINSGKLIFFYDLLGANRIEHDAFMGACDMLAKTLNINIINGFPGV